MGGRPGPAREPARAHRPCPLQPRRLLIGGGCGGKQFGNWFGHINFPIVLSRPQGRAPCLGWVRVGLGLAGTLREQTFLFPGRLPPKQVVEQGLGAPPPTAGSVASVPIFPPWLGVVHPVSYHVSECVWGGFCTNFMAGGFSFHASLPPACPGATRLALPHAGVIGGGGWGSRVLWS